jgi:hypothetical protein
MGINLRILTLLGVLFATLPISSNAATSTNIICVTSKGQMVTRAKCRKGETALSVSYIQSLSPTVKGEVGTQGLPGNQGAIGPKGDKGDKGEPGIQGAVGLTGPIGPTGAKGDQGVSGVAGIQGLTGPKGDVGQGALETLKSGQTIRGIFGTGWVPPTINSPYNYFFTISFPAPIPQNVSSEMIAIEDTPPFLAGCSSCNLSDQIQPIERYSVCQGSSTNPTAPPGMICLYPTFWEGIQTLGFDEIDYTGSKGTPYGFGIAVLPMHNPARVIFKGVWAYTAP